MEALAAKEVTQLQAEVFLEKYDSGGFPGKTLSAAFVEAFDLDREDALVQEFLKETFPLWAMKFAYAHFVED